MRSDAPSSAQVQALREAVQAHYQLGIGAARRRCAAAVFSSERAWQQWETGERRMHPSMWAFAQLRTNSHPAWKLTCRT